MSVHIIELSDHNVRIYNSAEVLAESPGFANIAHKSPIFGLDAQQQSRLHPHQSFNQFWSQLSLDPLVNTNTHFRHQADLAYGHLLDLANSHSLTGDVIFAVPSNYNRTQLAILLGLVKQCPFEAVGVVDLALLNTINAETSKNSAGPSQALFIDIQLHQTVITTLINNAGQLSRNKVLQVPASGLLALYDGWANMISDEFIKQSRFDPQHNADTEQYVYNQLKPWLALALQSNEVALDINNKGTIHQAKLNLSYFEQKTHDIFARIKTEIDTLISPDTNIYMPASMASLPGLARHFPNIIKLDELAQSINCFDNLNNLKSEPGSLGLVSKLPIKLTGKSPTNSVSLPSHFLLHHKAYALADNTAIPTGLTFSLQPEGYLIRHNPTLELHLNGKPLLTDTLLQLGDKLEIINSNTTLQFIQVD